MSRHKNRIKQLEERMEYLKTELAHERYHDGWVVKGMKEELEFIEKELITLKNNNDE